MNPLEQWEARLKPYFKSRLRFIGEIPLSFSDVEEMGEAVKAFIQRQGLPRATAYLIRDYPLTFLTLMSAYAAFNSQRNYWQSFSSFIGDDYQNILNHKWHKEYTRLAKAYHLKVFDFTDDNNPYVMSIRFQGGIPAYSLPDYFERMVLPAVEREGLREANPEQSLKYLLDHAYFVDSPVLDFLKYSGDLGVEFFAESCKLARHAVKNHGEILSTDQVDLPIYVVKAFEAFLERKEDERQHWTKPYIQAAPYSEDTAANLILPQQEINLDLAASRLFWKITYPELNSSQERTCRVSRSRQSVVILPDYLAIPRPLQQVVVSLHAVRTETGQVEELRRWNLPFIPATGKPPLLVFKVDENSQLISSQLLPADEVFLLVPITSQLIFEGSARKVEECVSLVEAWSGWRMDRWDLSLAWSVTLERAGQPLGDVVPVQGAIALPELTGGHLFQFQEYPEQLLYTSGVPSLKVPLSSGGTIQTRLATWQVQIRSLWEANPCINQTIRLSDYADHVEIKEDRGIFPLSQLLGNNPAGIYEIRATGPRGISAEYRVRLWPKLLLFSHSMQIIPPEQTPKPSVFLIRLPDGATCAVQPGSETVEIKSSPAGFQITAPQELNRVQLDLLTPSDRGGMVRVPVSIPLPRLRWALVSEKNQGNWDWDQKILHRSIDQLIQDGNASLHVEMYGLGKIFNGLRIRLVEINDEEKIQQETRLIHTDFTQDWLRVTLGQYSTTIRSIYSLARFELVVFPQTPGSDEIRFPLLELSRALEIKSVKMEPVSDTSWKLTWQEEHPLRNRRVMIRPAWQPWQKPWEFKIPNKARGEFILDSVSLPKMRYLLYFYILPDYEQSLQEPPVGVEPILLDLCSLQDRVDTLNLALSNPELSFNDKFRHRIELATIYNDLEDGKKRDNSLSLAASSLIHLTSLDFLIGTLYWMQDKSIDQPIKSFFFNAMFHLQIVSSMLRTYNLYDPSLVEYLSFTSRVKTIPADSAKLLLKRVDDPIAIASCVRNLINKLDNDLPAIVVKMMSEARLSLRDALDLLNSKPAWAIEKIADLPIDPFTDSLIAGLLPKLAQLQTMDNDPRILTWMERAIPYEKDDQVVLAYLRLMFTGNYPNRFNLLMKLYQAGQLVEEDLLQLLSQAPKTALEFLESTPLNENQQRWMDELVKNFPSAVDIIAPGSFLLTPFGKAKVDYIEHISTGRVNQIRLGTPDYRLNLLIGEGKDRFRVIIDYHDMMMSVLDRSTVWKCTTCGYLHPEQKLVNRHASHAHLYFSVSMLHLPLRFVASDIQIIPEK